MYMFRGVTKVFLLMCIISTNFVEPADLNEVERLVKQWSPLVWMSPDEKYMPLSVEEFLKQVHVADERGQKIQTYLNSRILQHESKLLNLMTHRSIENLKTDNSSVIFGKNPNNYSVSIYALVTYCFPIIKESSLGNIESVYGSEQKSLNFYVSYWIFFPYNEGKEVCFLGRVPTPKIFNTCLGHIKTMGNHIGDWEHMSLSFAGKSVPDKLYLSVHDAGVYYNYDEKHRHFKYHSKVIRKGVAQVPKFPQIVRTQGKHPVVFSAYGSHGLWASPGEHDFIRVPRLTDSNGYGIPWKTWRSIKIYHIGRSVLPHWMTFRGKWGNPKKHCLLFKKFGICEYSDGPAGPLRSKQDFYCWPS